MSKKQSRMTKQANAQRAAERAAAMRREQAKKDRRRRTIVVGAVAIGVLALIVGIFAFVQSTRDSAGDEPGQVAGAPNGAVDEYAVSLDADGATGAGAVTVEVYEDFLCPVCGQFESDAGDTLREYAESDDVQVNYRPISFLDRASNGTEYSTRSMNAVGVVLDESGPEVALKMHDGLFANQPAENTDGLSDEELIALAVEAGADRAAVAQPIEDVKFEQWVDDATAASQNEGVGGTPTVVVNGEKLEDNSVESLTAAVESAQQE